MNNEFFKKNQGLIIAVVIIVILIIISVSRNSDNKTPIPEKSQSEEQTIKDENQTEEPSKPTPGKPTTGATNQVTGSLIREGTLLTSDNSQRGNYMIKTATSNFYLKTSRDFSPLLNKQVKMVADGTVEKFTLIDIVAK